MAFAPTVKGSTPRHVRGTGSSTGSGVGWAASRSPYNTARILQLIMISYSQIESMNAFDQVLFGAGQIVGR